jgi:hypothetical protein
MVREEKEGEEEVGTIDRKEGTRLLRDQVRCGQGAFSRHTPARGE